MDSTQSDNSDRLAEALVSYSDSGSVEELRMRTAICGIELDEMWSKYCNEELEMPIRFDLFY